MSATRASASVRRLLPAEAARVAVLLESDFGKRPDGSGALANQHLLDALDRGRHERFLVWPDHDPLAVVYSGSAGTVIPAGDPRAAAALAIPVDRTGWRVLIGDALLGRALLGAAPTPVFRRRARWREQRFMAVWPSPSAPVRSADLPGLRPAALRDLDAITEFACRLHVEDHMGPPIHRSGRSAVRTRMMESLSRSATWVVEREGAAVAKVDLSLHSPRRGAQIAGVYVDRVWRGQGIATGAVASIAARLLDEGLPGVTLHVRCDNGSAIAAYRRAGFADEGAWILGLR